VRDQRSGFLAPQIERANLHSGGRVTSCDQSAKSLVAAPAWVTERNIRDEEQSMRGNLRLANAHTDTLWSNSWRKHGLFVIRVVMALTLVAISTFTLVSAELHLTGGRSLSSIEATDALSGSNKTMSNF
jgi:hypothetical protein